jgi:hypothetical protein
MKSFNISFEQPRIKINGIEFIVRKSDKAIIESAEKVDEKYAGKDMLQPDNLLSFHNDIEQQIDEILGSEATKKIFDSIEGLEGDISFAGLQIVYAEVLRVAGAAYAESLKLKYD